MVRDSRSSSHIDRHLKALSAQADEISQRIARKFSDLATVHDRMDADYALYTLEQWKPGYLESLSAEDIYTTNEPRVLAEKVISFITATELVVRVPNDDAQEPQGKAERKLGSGEE